MTIDLRPILLALPVVGLVWVGVLAGVMRFGGPAPAALVIFPPPHLLDGIKGVAVLSAGPYSVTVNGGAGLVAALYKAGAPLVLPAGLTSCLPQNR